MIHASLRVVVPTEKRPEAARLVRSLLGPTSAEPGCIHCGSYTDFQNESVLCYVEDWETEEDLRRHIRSRDYRKFLALMDLSSEPPDLKFQRVSETLGIEYLARVRLETKHEQKR
ncbi:MAG: putative quinol monooxygenase [Planctomycetota bacterium]